MANIIDMQVMRYINLFQKVTGIETRHCFQYNNQIIFAVPKTMLFKAIGKDGRNVKMVSSAFRKKIKIIPMAEGPEQLSKFIEDLVAPITFNGIEMSPNQLTLNAGRESKAALIGRNRTREKELAEILKGTFKIPKLKIA